MTKNHFEVKRIWKKKMNFAKCKCLSTELLPENLSKHLIFITKYTKLPFDIDSPIEYPRLLMNKNKMHGLFHFPTNTGMFAGYILNRYKSPPAAITPFINIVLWLMSLGLMLLLVFGVWNGTLSLLWTALYVSLGHSGELSNTSLVPLSAYAI